MIEYKRISFKYVVFAFLAAACLIILLSIDRKINEAPPVEDIFIEELYEPEQEIVETSSIHEVKDGENLTIIFEDYNISLNTVYQILKLDRENENELRDIKPGDEIKFSFINDKLNRIEIKKDTLNSIRVNVAEDISIEKIVKDIQKIRSISIGEVQSSFYESGLKANMPESIIMDFAFIFGWDIDFFFDVRNGDTFSVIYETDYSEGEKISSGDIVFAEFVNNGQRYVAQRYFDNDLGKQYFDENGNNVKKAFLRAPLDFAYISSHFNPNRMHPILHKIKAHNGVDYAAERNTPIKASGDGFVQFIGRQRGYGRTIEIKHGGNIKTLYAHLERFNNKIKVGDKVKQGDIIGYVGDSGDATGPHLHFEFWQGEVRTDPVKVELPSAKPINQSELKNFNTLLQESIETLKVFNTENSVLANE